MANETTLSTAAEFRLASVIPALQDLLLEEARPAMVMKPFVKEHSIVDSPSNVLDIPVLNDTGAASSLAEATAGSNTAINPTEISITVGKYAQIYAITDEVVTSQFWGNAPIGDLTNALLSPAIMDKLMPYIQVGGRALAEAVDNALCALLGSHTDTVGTSGSDLTHTQFLTAMYELQNNDAKGQKIAVLHPIQVHDLRVALGVGQTSQSPLLVQAGQKFINDTTLYGYCGNLHGVEVFETTLVPTANTGANRAGGMFINQWTYGLAIKWYPKIEFERQGKSFLTDIICSISFGVGEMRDGFGVSIITDA